MTRAFAIDHSDWMSRSQQSESWSVLKGNFFIDYAIQASQE